MIITRSKGNIARSAHQGAERDIIPKTNKVLEIATKKNWLTILVKVGFNANYVNLPKMSRIAGILHVDDLKNL